MPDFKGATQDANLILEKLGCTLTCRFIPWSLSRSAKEKNPSLNWNCTLSRGGHSYSFSYTTGLAHCHAYRNPVRFPNGKKDEYATKEAIRHECETGKKATPPVLGGGVLLALHGRLRWRLRGLVLGLRLLRRQHPGQGHVRGVL